MSAILRGLLLFALLSSAAGAQNAIWIRQLGTGTPDYARAAAPDGAGGVYVGGRMGTYGPAAWFARYDGAGDQTWIRILNSGDSDYAYVAAPDGAGGLYVGGITLGDLGGPNAGSFDAWIARYDGNGASADCGPVVPNSTGQPGRVHVTGSTVVAVNDLTLVASQLPPRSFGFFITSQTRGFVAGAGGSQGNLCLSGQIGRFVGPGQVLSSGATGTFSLLVDLEAMPTPLFPVAVQPGETWNFQAWHRDANPTPTSNFTDAVSVTFE
ncbi:MAG: hypothetical protein GY711_23090 [bacterium]|nr:hypothetical protein [bacterium]